MRLRGGCKADSRALADPIRLHAESLGEEQRITSKANCTRLSCHLTSDPSPTSLFPCPSLLCILLMLGTLCSESIVHKNVTSSDNLVSSRDFGDYHETGSLPVIMVQVRTLGQNKDTQMEDTEALRHCIQTQSHCDPNWSDKEEVRVTTEEVPSPRTRLYFTIDFALDHPALPRSSAVKGDLCICDLQ